MDLAAPTSLKHRTFAMLEGARSGTLAGRRFQRLITTLIILNIVALFLETEASIYRQAPQWFIGFDAVSVAVFTVEYLARIWSCTSQPAYASPITGRLRFALKPLSVVDLLAVLPFFLPFFGLDLRFVRSIRLVRLLRLAKLGRYSQAMGHITRALRGKKEELAMSGVLGVILMILASSLMYFAENTAQPDKFSSIPASMWWAVATLTTVGYGDIYPITTAGKLLGSLVAVIGIGMFALPASILGSAFMEEIGRERQVERPCPHCGRPRES